MAKKKTSNKKVKEVEKQTEILSSLPQNILKIGGHVEADKNIYISQSAYKAIHSFTKDKLENESGGILMGYTMEGAGKTNIIIDGFIEAKHSEATPTTLTFTHETWEYVHSEAEKKYSEYKIIGWIHTHPSFGIFLSEYDKFIQQNFFDGENQVAYVVDPIQKTEGFYFWINEKIEKCNGFYIYDKTGTPIVIEPDQPKEEKNSSAPAAVPQKKTWRDYLLVLTTALTIVMLFITLSINGRLSDLENDTSKIIAEQKSAEEYIISLLNEAHSYKCKIIFLNHDGKVIKSSEYQFGATITLPANPTKDADERYTYEFAGWDKTPSLALENTVFKATFKAVEREYTIKFVDVDGNLLSEATYHYEDTVIVPEYTATKESEEPNNYNYVLKWDKEVTTVKGDATYTAVFEKEYIEYTVRFVRDDGYIIEEKTYHYNDTISVEDPTKDSTETHTYTFAQWDREFAPVTENTEYIATFNETRISTTEGEVEGNGGEV